MNENDPIAEAMNRMEKPNELDSVRVRSFLLFQGQCPHGGANGYERSLQSFREAAEKDGIPIVRRDTEDLLRFVVKTAAPKRILEIGTAVGYSACLFHGCVPDAVIDTVEIDPVRADLAEEAFQKFRCEAQVNVLTGDGAEIVKQLTGPYDLVFLDAAKSQYEEMLPAITDLMKSGSVLIADNLFEKGEVLEPRYGVFRRNRTIRTKMRAFLYALESDPRLDTALVNVGDGVSLSRMV